MVVTQVDIDNAITKANDSLYAIIKKIEAEQKKGYPYNKELAEQFEHLEHSKWFLTNSATLLTQECITEDDIWTQINFVNANSFVC